MTKLKLTAVKAIIKFNTQHGNHVVYYRQGRRFFKMLDSHRIVPLSAFVKSQSSFNNSIMNNWSKRSSIQVVYGDEQVMIDGKPLDIQMDIFRVSVEEFNVV